MIKSLLWYGCKLKHNEQKKQAPKEVQEENKIAASTIKRVGKKKISFLCCSYSDRNILKTKKKWVHNLSDVTICLSGAIGSA